MAEEESGGVVLKTFDKRGMLAWLSEIGFGAITNTNEIKEKLKGALSERMLRQRTANGELKAMQSPGTTRKYTYMLEDVADFLLRYPQYATMRNKEYKNEMTGARITRLSQIIETEVTQRWDALKKYMDISEAKSEALSIILEMKRSLVQDDQALVNIALMRLFKKAKADARKYDLSVTSEARKALEARP